MRFGTCETTKKILVSGEMDIADESLDKHARYRQTHRDKTRAATAAWYVAHRDEILEKRRQRYHENRETVKESHREWYIANRDKILEKARARKTECPHCHLMYTTWYLKKHLETRHKICK